MIRRHTAGVSYHQPQLYQYNTNQPPVLYQTQRRIATTNHNKAGKQSFNISQLFLD